MKNRLLVLMLPMLLATNAFGQPTDESRLARVTENLAKEQQQAQQALLRERESLKAVERGTSQQSVTANQLEQARLDIAALQSQHNSISSRLLSRREALRDIQSDIERVTDRLTNASKDEDTAELNTSREEFGQQRDSLKQVSQSLSSLQRTLDNRLSVARQQLSVLQSRFELPELSAMTRPPGFAERKLRNEVDQLLAEASDLRLGASATAEKIATLKTTSPTTLNVQTNAELAELNEQQRWLAAQAQAAEERAELRQKSLKQLRAEQVIRVLSSFPTAESTPLRVLRNGSDNMQKLIASLEEQQQTLKRRVTTLSSQVQLADTTASTTYSEKRKAIAVALEQETQQQLTAMSAVLEQAKIVDESYQRTIATRGQSALMERNNWPADRYAWQSLANSFIRLPGRVLSDYANASRKLGNAIQRMLRGENMLAAFTFIGILIASAFGFRLLLRWVRNRPTDDEALKMGRSLKEPLRILKNNYFLLLLPIIMGVVGWQLGLSIKSLTLLVVPLVIWPAVTVSIGFTRYFLRTYTPDISRAETTQLVRLASWVITFTAVLAACLVIARTVALSPLVTSTIEGISMLCLLVIALPLIKLRGALLSSKREYFATGEASRKANRKRHWLSMGSGVLVFTLITSAVVGLAGYTNLAWSIARYLAVLVMVVLGWLMARSLLREFIDAWHSKIVERDPDSGAFWRQCVLAPLYGILVLLLTALAGFTLYSLYGWNAQTPIVQSMPKLFNYSLFKVKDTEIQLSNFIIAAFIVFMVFRAASWSRQVSYRFALQKVQDVGIRNSLSTFIQYTVVIAGLMIAMRTIGLDLTALTVFAGAMGVGIGFGLQQIVVNFISGILLLIERPLRTSDLVNVDKYEGEVTHIGIRSLTVKTFDAQEVVIPNSAVITQPFTNWTRSDDTMRTILLVGISYNDDPEKAIEVIKKICVDHPAVLSEPAPKVLLWEYADSALIIRIQLFSQIRGAIGRVDMRSQLLLSIRRALQDAGMSIPFPQRDLHIIKQPD